MFLKRLTCHGFKSFADKTDFEFKPGVTGIVGPNGCGKSNVVDSIKWVLGDQSARSLRGKQMQDVIFNGSGTRRSAGMAQVDLMFDNADRRLGRDTDEVLITRRLYRSGESEYLINNEQVRLRDVKELFMDTGIGVGAYSIIEQGKVDVLLQANPLERRLIFEEAAGISRYKSRKREAERKLERVEQNLLRLEDIIEELEKRLRSIKYQAGKARNWQEYDRQYREKRATYSLADYHRLSERRNALTAELTQCEDSATGFKTSIDSADTRASVLDRDLLTLEADLRQIEQQILGNASEMTANRERIDGSRQRIDELAEVRSRAQQRLAVEKQRAVKLRAQIETEDAAIKSLESEIKTAQSSIETLAEEDRDLSHELTALNARREDDKAGVIDVLRRTAQLNNEIQSLEQRCQQLEGQKGRLQTRHEQVQSELRELLEAKDQIGQRAGQITELLQAQNEQLEQKKQQAMQLDASRAELNQQLAAAKEFRSGLQSRKQLLADLDQQLEGVDAGIRELLHQKEQDQTGQTWASVRGMVADLISTHFSNAVLIEAALNGFDQYLVVENSQEFFQHADALADFPGRVRAICVDQLPPFIDGRDFSQQEGFVAYAMDLVRYAPEDERLVRHLLGKTIVVHTFEDAQRLAQQNPPSYRYLTQSGQLFDPQQGISHLGPAGVQTGLISRKSELEEIAQQVEQVDERIAIMSERLDDASAEMEHLEHVQQELRNAVFEARRAEVENNAAKASTESAVQRLMREQPLISGEVDSIVMQMREAAERSSRSSQSLTQLEHENANREQRIKLLEEEIATVIHRRSQTAERLTEAKVALGRLGQQRSMVADNLRGLREAGLASEEAVKASAQDAEEAVHRITQAERAVLTAQTRLSELFALKERLDVDLLSRQHAREQMRLELEQLAAAVKADRTALAEVEEKLHAFQMESQEVSLRIETLTGRVREDLGIDLAEAYAGYQHADQDWAALEQEIEELREKIKRLGNVNLDAIAEQEELEKRAEFLTTQRDDLRRSRKQLEELIEQLNQECRERFTQTFEAVRIHFQELFRKLFGGGKADIIFEAPAEGQPLDVLEAGIEIQARPPGKELQRISLMSGGEKSMTAIALLLAIFRSRPSPFTILDEVDAALDEANNERFNRIIVDFLNLSQFIVITHSKRTMTVADLLYGVTMQEAGVSKRVSVKFDRGDEEAAAVA